MTLEAYRFQVIERLKACESPDAVRALLAEVQWALGNRRISQLTQDSFWQTLSDNLDVIAQEWTALLGKQAAATLGAVIGVAQIVIAAYLDRER